MDAMKIMITAIVGTMLALVLKEQKPYMGMALSAVCALCVFFMGLPYMEKILSCVRVIYSSFNSGDGYMGMLLKIAGIATISTLAANMCADAGMSAVSSSVTFAGKIICMCLTLPVIGDFFNELIKILP